MSVRSMTAQLMNIRKYKFVLNFRWHISRGMMQ